jgi:hypothetical protein
MTHHQSSSVAPDSTASIFAFHPCCIPKAEQSMPEGASSRETASFQLEPLAPGVAERERRLHATEHNTGMPTAQNH